MPYNPLVDWLKQSLLSPISPLKVFEQTGRAMMAPQGPNETDLDYGARSMISRPAVAVGNDLSTAFEQAIDTPAKRQSRQPKPVRAASVFPERYDDPVYDEAEAEASRITGVPQALLRSIRMNGERSNASAVSSAGARTPYQVIPGTRQGIVKNYKVDPWKDPRSAALGAAYVLREQAGNPGPGQWGPQQALRATAGYFGGAAAANNPFATWGDGGSSVGQYTQRVLGANTGLAAPFVTPDPRNVFQQQAMGQLGAAQQAALQPFSATIERPPMPEAPRPTPVARTDFSQSDARLQELMPQEMLEKEKLSMERRGWFQGLAQALSSAPEGVGLGKLFGMIGGASLGGRMAAQDEIQRRQDVFEQKMTVWKTAMFNNDLNKAQTAAREAQLENDRNDQYALNQWQTAMQQWRADNNVTMQGDALVATRADKNGNLIVSRIPVPGAVNSAFALRRAELLSGLGNQAFQGQYMVSQANNSLMGGYAGAMLSQSLMGGGGEDAASAAAAGPAGYATFVAQTDKVAEVVGEEGAQSLNERVDNSLQKMGFMPGTAGYTQRREQLVATELVNLTLMDPSYMTKLQQAGRASDLFDAAERYAGRRERTSVDSRGRRTTSTTYDDDNSLGIGQ